MSDGIIDAYIEVMEGRRNVLTKAIQTLEALDRLAARIPVDGDLPHQAIKGAVAVAEEEAYEAALLWRTSVAEMRRAIQARAAQRRPNPGLPEAK